MTAITFVHSSGKVRGTIPMNAAQVAIISTELKGVPKRVGAYVFDRFLLSADGITFQFATGLFRYCDVNWCEWWAEAFDVDTPTFEPPIRLFDKTITAFARWSAARETSQTKEVRPPGRPKAQRVNWALNEAFLWVDLFRAAGLSIDDSAVRVVTRHPNLFAGTDQSLKKAYHRAIRRGLWRPYRTD